MCICFGVQAQEVKITGVVSATEFEGGLPGATILEKGTNNGTVTDVNGKFSISVSEGATLVFSSVGYISQEKKVANSSSLKVSLEPDITNLEEVVVIGYGTVKKRDLTGAVTSVKSEDIRQVPAQNPLESIQGKVAGVDITRGSGSSSSGINIRIRGNRSIGAGNNPLFIVDGVQTGNIDNINPNDIESMEFLKDASSTAIYGWQGANGIVIVTTKKGATGTPKVTFNSYFGLSQVSRYPSVMNGDEYAAIKREANRTTGKWSSEADDPLIFNTQELAAVQNGDWIDYQDLLFKNGTQQNYNIGVNAGSDKTKVYTSLDYYSEKGILKFDDIKRYTLRANVDHTFNNWVKAGLQSQVANRDESYRRDPLNMANKIIPLGTVYDENGDFIVYPLGGSSISPLADEQVDVFSNTGKITDVIANVYLELKPFAGFSFRSNFGSSISNSRIGLFEGSNSISRNGGNSRAQYTASNSRFFNWDNVINYSKEIKDHSFAITALSSYVQNEGDNVLAQGESQLLPGQLYFGLGNAPDNITINSGYAKWNVLSFAARLNYNYKGKYLITLTDRADGASRLSKGNKWAFFPSAAFAWRIVDENFMENIASISELKLRLSYGVAGNSGIQPYGTQSSLTRMPMAFGESSFQGFTFSPLLGNPDAGWELSATTNLGVDFGLWKNRLSATVDIYDTRTSDLLLPRGLPPTTGVQQVYQNIGKTRNHGVEIGLNTVNIESKDFQWESMITFTRNQEEIVSLVTEGVDDIGNGWFVGEPISVFYDYEKLGIWQSSEADEAQSFGQAPGDIKVRDLNGDGQIDAVNDRKVLGGDNRPNWFGGLNNKINYKGFDLSVYLFARWGQTINPNFLSRYDRQSNLNNSSTAIDYWTPENPTNEYPRPNAGLSGSSTLYWSTIGYVDGSYIRLRNLSLGYTLPVKDNPLFSNVRIYLSGTNLLTWTKSSKLDEYDPERGGGESFPMLKSYMFGLNLGF
ncbi:SusC/RagA family TonB-linked outer membrane protein [Echinicola pacifica]|uniref:SusC/RagA family TonB-linked outer membrane protein n=2 Tax=Echinicola pacifica TaxID=346377 RepID=A0A918PUW3_9BACT|nr:SusC/RagA family TonB-linked outer membrane protein [Echinicola pacifica]